MERFGGDRKGPLENSFEDAIDDAIYTGGLRLPGSLKANHCKCTKRDRPDCQDCFGNGVIREWRPYLFHCMLDAQGAILPKDNETFMAFEHHLGLARKINWVTMNAPGKELVKEFKYPEGAPEPFPSIRKKKKGRKNLSDKKLWEIESKSNRRKNLTPILETRPLFTDVLNCIRKSHKIYGRLFATNVSQTPLGDYLVNVSGVGCQHCFIKGEMKEPVEHKSNRIWFYISKKKNRIYQHCYDPDCRGSKKEVSQPDVFAKKRLFAGFNASSSSSSKSVILNAAKLMSKSSTSEERKTQLLAGLKNNRKTRRKPNNPKRRPNRPSHLKKTLSVPTVTKPLRGKPLKN